MPKDYARTDRVAEQIQRELAELVRLDVKDPRVHMVTLTGVEVAARLLACQGVLHYP